MKSFDAHCNKYNPHLEMIVDMVEYRDKPIAQFDAGFGYTTRALSYLLPNNKFNVYDEDKNILTHAERDFIKNLSINRVYEKIHFYEWTLEFPLAAGNFELLHTDNYLHCFDPDVLQVVWENMKCTTDKMVHTIDLHHKKNPEWFVKHLHKEKFQIKTFNNHKSFMLIYEK